MSGDALDAVKRLYSHPQVKGNVRTLLDQIAELIADGQTTTRPITLRELAALMQLDEKTVWRARRTLKGLRVVKIHGGGRGGTPAARYELIHVAGTRPTVDGELPLRADLRPVTRRTKPRTPDAQADLFAPPPAAASPVRVGHDDGTISRVRVWLSRVTDSARVWLLSVGHFARLWLFQTGKTPDRLAGVVFQSGDSPDRLADPEFQSGETPDRTLPLDVTDARARAVLDLNTRKKELVLVPAPADRVDAFLDWFAATYPLHHQGARCTVDRTKDGPLVQDLLERGRTVDRLQLMALAMWALTTDGLAKSERWYICEHVKVRNVWLLHKKADVFDLEVSRAPPPPSAADEPYDAVWQQILQQIEPKVDRHTFHQWFVPLVMVTESRALIEVTTQGPESPLFASWISKHHGAVVQAAVDAVRPGARVTVIDVWALQRQQSERERQSG